MKLTTTTAGVPDLHKVVARLAKAATRLHLTGKVELVIDWATKRELTRTRVIEKATEGVIVEALRDVRKYAIEVVDASITLPDLGAIRAAGSWAVLGRVERLEEGKLDVIATSAASLPKCETYRTAGTMACDHCKANRRRDTVFIIESAARTLSVGRECLKAYVTDLDAILGSFEFQAVINELIDLDAEGSDREGAGIFGYGRAGFGLNVFDAVEAQSACIATIRAHGGFSPSRITDRYDDREVVNVSATWRIARNRLTFSPNSAQLDDSIDKRQGFSVTDTDRAEAANLVNWIAVLEVDATKDEFLAQLKDIARIGEVSERKLALWAALQKAKARWDSDHRPKTIPAPEGRVAVEGVITSMKDVESDFGMTTKISVELDGGARVYGSLPGSLSARVGSRIKFSAKFEPKAGDPFFAFYSRPTKASVIS